MKSTFGIVSVMAACILFFSGCAINGPLPPAGGLFTNVKAPDASSTVALRTGNMDKTGTSKRGEASAMAILGIVAVGDASIKAAMDNGGITKIHHVDYDKTLVFGGALYHSLTTIVYGE